MQELKIHGVYKHFKGDYYLVEDIAKDSETKEEMVLYRRLRIMGKTKRNVFIRSRPWKVSWCKTKI